MYLLWMDFMPGPKHHPKTWASSTNDWFSTINLFCWNSTDSAIKSPWSPGTFSLPKAAWKGKPRCNLYLSCAHQLGSCAIHLLMVTFRLSVVQRGERWHHCIREPSLGFTTCDTKQPGKCLLFLPTWAVLDRKSPSAASVALSSTV